MRGDVALALLARLLRVDAAGDVDREDQLEIDRQLLRHRRPDEQRQ